VVSRPTGAARVGGFRRSSRARRARAAFRATGLQCSASSSGAGASLFAVEHAALAGPLRPSALAITTRERVQSACVGSMREKMLPPG